MNVTAGLLGGACIGLAAVWLYLSIGRIAGISGITAQALQAAGRTTAPRPWWALYFIVGLGAGGWLAYMFTGAPVRVDLSLQNSMWLLAGGVLVGFGTRLGSGCTSGHGVCGMARFSTRSLSATLTFLLVGVLTATLVDLLGLK